MTLSALTVPGSEKLVNRKRTTPTATPKKLVYLQGDVVLGKTGIKIILKGSP